MNVKLRYFSASLKKIYKYANAIHSNGITNVQSCLPQHFRYFFLYDIINNLK